MASKTTRVAAVKNVRIPAKDREMIAAAAAREHRSVSNFLLSAALERIAASARRWHPWNAPSRVLEGVRAGARGF